MENKQNSEHARKLNHEQQELILLRLAEFLEPKEILREVKESYGIELSEEAIAYYKREKRDRISEIRSKFNRELDTIRCANKFLRLKDIQRRLNQLRGKDDDKSLDLELKFSEQARKEREGFRAKVDLGEGTPDEVPVDPADLKALVDQMKQEREGTQETDHPPPPPGRD